MFLTVFFRCAVAFDFFEQFTGRERLVSVFCYDPLSFQEVISVENNEIVELELFNA